MGKESLGIFTSETLGFQNNWHHEEWYLILQNDLVQDKVSGELRPPKSKDETNNQIVIEAPRSHAKSTCFASNYPLWEIVRNRDVRVVIVSKTYSQAQAFLREITGHIEKNETFIARYGNLKPQIPETWTDSAIIVERPNYQLKDPTVSAVGAGGSILSKRADIIICDDLLNEENTRTADQREKMFEWFMNVLLPVLEPNGRIIVDGTIWHEEDLLEYLMGDPTYDIRKRYKAIIKDSDRQDLWDEFRKLWIGDNKASAIEMFRNQKEEMLKGAEVLWAKRWSYSMLMMKRFSMTERPFLRQYQNTIEAGFERIIKEDGIQRALERGKNLRLLRQYDKRLFLEVFSGIDPATGDAKDIIKGGWSVIFTLGVNIKTGMVNVLNIARGQWKSSELRRNIAEQYNAFHPHVMRVENNAFQKTLVHDLQDMEFEDMPIEGYETGAEKWDEYIGLDSLALLFENDRIIVPYDKSDPYTIRQVDAFLKELRELDPSAHTGDTVMAFWLAHSAYRQLRDSFIGDDIKISKKAGRSMYNTN